MKLQARKYQTATQVKGLSLEIIRIEEADSVHKLEGNKIGFTMVRNVSLLRGLRPWYGIEWRSQELGRSKRSLLTEVSANNLKRRGCGKDCVEVGLLRSRGVIGVMFYERKTHSKGAAVVCRGRGKRGSYREMINHAN